jgi:hypothetical protein
MRKYSDKIFIYRLHGWPQSETSVNNYTTCLPPEIHDSGHSSSLVRLPTLGAIRHNTFRVDDDEFSRVDFGVEMLGLLVEEMEVCSLPRNCLLPPLKHLAG